MQHKNYKKYKTLFLLNDICFVNYVNFIICYYLNGINFHGNKQ